jgi:hypothetical protein
MISRCRLRCIRVILLERGHRHSALRSLANRPRPLALTLLSEERGPTATICAASWRNLSRVGAGCRETDVHNPALVACGLKRGFYLFPARVGRERFRRVGPPMRRQFCERRRQAAHDVPWRRQRSFHHGRDDRIPQCRAYQFLCLPTQGADRTLGARSTWMKLSCARPTCEARQQVTLTCAIATGRAPEIATVTRRFCLRQPPGPRRLSCHRCCWTLPEVSSSRRRSYAHAGALRALLRRATGREKCQRPSQPEWPRRPPYPPADGDPTSPVFARWLDLGCLHLQHRPGPSAGGCSAPPRHPPPRIPRARQLRTFHARGLAPPPPRTPRSARNKSLLHGRRLLTCTRLRERRLRSATTLPHTV